MNKPVRLSVDASQSGLLPKDNQPVAYAPCNVFISACTANKKGVESDDKPLEAIFTKPIAKVSPRIQRLLIRLQNYHIKEKHVPGKLMFNADTLSRAHQEITYTNQVIPDAETEMQFHLLVANLPISEQKQRQIQLVRQLHS